MDAGACDALPHITDLRRAVCFVQLQLPQPGPSRNRGAQPKMTILLSTLSTRSVRRKCAHTKTRERSNRIVVPLSVFIYVHVPDFMHREESTLWGELVMVIAAIPDSVVATVHPFKPFDVHKL